MDKKNKKPLLAGKFKYGASAVVFTFVLVAFIVALNFALSVIEDKTGGLTFDVTNSEIFSVSEESKKALSGIDNEIEIIFCQPEDKINDDDSLYNAKCLAEDYANKFDNITVEYKDLVSNPSYFASFQKSSLDSITVDSVIINCKTTELYKILNARYMTKKTYDQYGNEVPYVFVGENQITTAILSIARDEESSFHAGIVSGHGENIDHNIVHYLEEYGYKVDSPLDLKTVSAKELSEYDLLIINNPQSDYFGDESPSINETMKLTQYVKDSFGNVMVFMDPYTNANMPNFDEFLEGFGVSVTRTPISDNKEGNRTGLAGDESFFGTYSEFTPNDDNIDYGYDIHKSISESGSGLRPRFTASCLIKIDEDALNNRINNLGVYSIVVTSEDGTAYVDEGAAKENPGSVPVMTVSKYSRLIPGDQSYTANVILCGSTGFIDEFGNDAVANTDLFKCLLVDCGNDTIVTGVEDVKFFDDHSIIVDREASISIMLFLAVLVPVIIAITGIAVYVVRKYFL